MAKKINYFLSFMKQGITTLADHAAGSGRRPSLMARIRLGGDYPKQKNGSDAAGWDVTKEIVLLGPGDVLGVNARIISRLAPAPDTNNFDASLTPFIEFRQPDFLWRFSSRQTPDGENWIPWLSLIILKADNGEEEAEFTKLDNTDRQLPARIALKPFAILPDLRASWRWAHVHLLESENAHKEEKQIENRIKKDPRKAVCRLLSPRRLQPLTNYHAFLVPAFKIGVDAALGISPSVAEDEVEYRTQLSWESPAEGAGKTLPYYHDWKFRTDTEGGFEYLVRKLEPRDLENMGTRTIDCSKPGYGMYRETGLELAMEAPLMSLDTEFQPWGMDDPETNKPNEQQKALAQLLNAGREEIDGQLYLRVTPPVYGEWYAGVAELEKKVKGRNQGHWLEELNLDFRHRAAAGLGVRFVKENQEELMRAAWEQFAKIKKVNQALNLGRFGREVSTLMYNRLEKMEDENLFQLALPLKYNIKYSANQDTPITTRSLSRDAADPSATIGKVLESKDIPAPLYQLKTQKYLDRGRKHRKDAAPGSGALAVIESSRIVPPTMKPHDRQENRTENPGEAEKVDPELFQKLGARTKEAIHPRHTIEALFKSRFRRHQLLEKRYVDKRPRARSTASPAEDELHPVMWYPAFHRPMYRFLRALSQDYILPGLEQVPPNAIGLLKTNRRFIEAFMVGLNHEFASELRWREFPTDMRGSYFRSFWDTSIYSLDNTEREQFRVDAIGIDLLDHINSQYGGNGIVYDWEAIEATYTEGTPNEITMAIARDYETAVEKWLLTRESDKDVTELGDWGLYPDKRLGHHPVPEDRKSKDVEGKKIDPQQPDQLVLLVRGELLQKFGNALIYLVGGAAESERPVLGTHTKRIFPVFEGALPPDVVFIGFPIRKSEVHNYFLILEERISELRFGLDIAQDDQRDPESLRQLTEADLSWQHFESVPEGNYLDDAHPLPLTMWEADGEEPPRWDNAAFIAKVMVQQPVRVAVRLGEMVPGGGE